MYFSEGSIGGDIEKVSTKNIAEFYDSPAAGKIPEIYDGAVVLKDTEPRGSITSYNDKKWVATALMWDPVKALEQSFLRTKNANYQEFNKMMDIRTNSSNNTVYADAEGILLITMGILSQNEIPDLIINYLLMAVILTPIGRAYIHSKKIYPF